MEENYRKIIHRIKKTNESMKRRAEIYFGLSKLDDRGTARSIKALQHASAPGKKLQRIGFILFWIPEPFGITNAIGGPMILAGKYLDNVYNGATISDIGHETKNFVGTVADFKDKLN